MKNFLQSLFLLSGALMLPAVAYAQQPLYGDVNGDLEVNIADINAVISVILDDTGFTQAADVNNDGEINISDINCIIGVILEGQGGLPYEHEYVDLGLPSGTLWATCNVGADTPEEYGDYFAWGETEPKDEYTWETYKWCNGTENSLTKYCTNSEYGTVDGKTELDLEDDAAYVNWGPKWHMPSDQQWFELHYYCSSATVERNGVKGCLVTGPNGNTIFFPGTYNSPSFAGSGTGCYWFRSGYGDNFNNQAYCFFTRHGMSSWSYNSDYRCNGHSVRAVRESPADYASPLHLEMGAVPIGETETGELSIANSTDEPMTFTFTADAPFLLRQGENSASSITVVVPGNSSATVTVMYTATSPGEYIRNVTIQSPEIDACQGVIRLRAVAYHGENMHQEYIDLGLPSGTLWATRNVGASSPEESGDYFAWGETEPKEVYNWETYKWCNGDAYSLTKYCVNSKYGTVDGKTELDPEDDAAQVNWGPEWRMPTLAQQQELLFNCTSLQTTLKGVSGRMFIGPNGNAMFLPAAGFRVDVRLITSEGRYWSHTLTNYTSIDANYLFFDEDHSGDYYGTIRYAGQSIRPVRASLNQQ